MECTMKFDEKAINVQELAKRLMTWMKALIPATLLLALYMMCVVQLEHYERSNQRTVDLSVGQAVESVKGIVEEPAQIYAEDFSYNPLEIPSLALPLDNIVAEVTQEQPIDSIPIVPNTEPLVVAIGTTDTLPAQSEPQEEVNNAVVLPYVTLHGNGGSPETIAFQAESVTLDSGSFQIPVRLGKIFDGWYVDPAGTIPFGQVEPGTVSVELYARWKEFPGFVSDDAGIITGYIDLALVARDGVLAFPSYDECIGLSDTALIGLEGTVTEVYIPANMVHIPEGIFDSLTQLMYIQVAAGNPSYYSESGSLYYIDGSIACIPAGRNYSLS